MRHSSSLPDRLGYLESFRKKFASRRPEDLNEVSGSAVLMPLLSTRLRGLPLLEAEKILSEDFATLQQWLSDNAHQNDPLQFVLGFALSGSAEELAKQIKQNSENAAKSQPCLHVDLPVGAKFRRVPGGKGATKIITLRGIWLTLDALPEEAVTGLYDGTREVQPGEWSQNTVTFGPVTGRKLTIKGESWFGQTKTITYALNIPGGHVIGSLSPVGKKTEQLNWDENPFELILHTLRIDES